MAEGPNSARGTGSNKPGLSLHVPEPKFRPGDAVDFGHVDIGAPGSGVISTVPTKSGKNVVSGYASFSGTSMATPHVSGAAALYTANHPTATAAQIKAAILGSAVPTASLTGITVTGGRLNVSGF